MALIAVAGGKGAQGITTTATVLAAVWPTAPLLADCDPSGGDLAWRLRAADGGWLARDRGVVGLAAAARAGAGRLDVAAQAQPAVGGLSVLAGVESAAQALTIGPLWPSIAESLAGAGVDVIADCGRLVPGLPNAAVVDRADLLLLAARGTPEAVDRLRQVVDAVTETPSGASARVHVVVLADLDAAEEVRAVLAAAGRPAPQVHQLPLDPLAAAALAGMPTRGLDRSRLVAAARRVAADLHSALRVLEPASGPAPADAVVGTG